MGVRVSLYELPEFAESIAPIGERGGLLRYMLSAQFMERLPIPDAPATERQAVAGLAQLGDLTHAIETLLEQPVQADGGAAPLIAELEGSFDQLHGMVQLVAQGRAPAYPQATIDRLLALARRRPTAVMCAEAVWWRCHRRLIADVLTARGVEVLHILDAGHVQQHALTDSARLVDGRLVYPPPQDDLFA